MPLALPFIVPQPAPASTQGILPLRQRSSVQRRRLRRQLLPGFPRFRLKAFKRQTALLQPQLGLLGLVQTIGLPLFPVEHLISDNDRRVEGLKFRFAPTVAEFLEVFVENAFEPSQFRLPFR